MNMNTDMPAKQHKLVLSEIFSSGAQEYYCPICGRRFVIQFLPNFKRIMLDHGDEMAVHIGGTPQRKARACEPSGDQMGKLDDPYLQLWRNYLDNIEL